jgi:C-terminal processing protease CtpA/Prc
VAAILRHAGAALLIGDTTAGDAAVVTDVNLSTGQRLRLTQGRVRLPDGQFLSAAGVVPDLRLPLDAAVERAFLRDPFTAIRSQTNSTTATNSITTVVRVRKRLTEADLVRERERTATDPKATPAAAEPVAAPVVRDPVLARGLDFLKGQTLVRTQ